MEDTKPKQKTQFVGVRLDEETLAALKNVAQQNGRSVSAELRERLAQFLKTRDGVSTPETEGKC
jgi:plasmid stability protein